MNRTSVLPDRVDEILSPRAAELDFLGRKLLDIFRSWGYQYVIPPLIEFLDSLSLGSDKDLNDCTFKLLDPMGGKLLGVRADFTPQVARIDSLENSDEIARFCYSGPVLHTTPTSLRTTRTPIQIGAELYGTKEVSADQEIVVLMCEVMRTAKIKGYLLELGHVGIYRSIVNTLKLNEYDKKILFQILQRKAIDALQLFLLKQKIRGVKADMLTALCNLHGGKEVLEQARSMLKGKEVMACLDQLECMVDIVSPFLPKQTQIRFDLAELRGYFYHTGMLYTIYSTDNYQAIANGGRYDNIGANFGNKRPATGFTVALQELFELSSRFAPNSLIKHKDAIAVEWNADPDCWKLITSMRKRGHVVEFISPNHTEVLDKGRFEHRIVRHRKTWKVVPWARPSK